MSPILVTGSNGTIGGKVVAALTNAGADVRPADLDTPFDFTKPQTWGGLR